MTKPKFTIFCAAIFCALLMAFDSSAATVRGRVWSDTNTNGIQDGGEPGMGGVWVELQTAAGAMVTGMLSNPDGSYQFNNVAAGSYRIKFANPGGMFQTPKDLGGNDAVDSDADGLGFTDAFTLTANQTAAYDAGFTAQPVGCFTPINITLSNVLCNNNGTPCNPADDTFTFEITATGGTGPWGWDIPNLGISMFPYGTVRQFGPYLVSAGLVTLTLQDHDNPDCKASITVTPPTCAPPTGVLTLTCQPASTVYTDPGKTTWTVAAPPPTATTTCPIGSVTVTQTGGPLPGTQVGPGMYTFTFKATDDCCNERTCSVKVTVEKPCDEKTIGGIIFDLLDVIVLPGNHKTYCIRVTNTTANPLQYVAFQLPNGIVAESPANNAIYTAPSGRQYEVRNPNFSPFYSIRFKVLNGMSGIKSGQSDIFKYTLQPQTNPWYIRAIARTAPKIFNETYLTTADCMPLINPTGPNNTFQNPLEAVADGPMAEDRTEEANLALGNGKFNVFPNPAYDYLMADISKWTDVGVSLQLFDAQGRVVRSLQTVGSDEPALVELSNLPTGVYHLRALPDTGSPEVRRVVVKQ